MPYAGVMTTLRTFGDAEFDLHLGMSVERWQNEGKLSAWVKVPLELAALATTASRHAFTLHHAEVDGIVLYRWLGEGEDKVPPYPRTQIGCAGFALNDLGELLVVKERGSGAGASWKLPGGLADLGESFYECAARETLEETGVRSSARSLLGLWHRHEVGHWGHSDIYAVVRLDPEAAAVIAHDPVEISAARWYCLQSFVDDEDHPLILKIAAEIYGVRRGGNTGAPENAAETTRRPLAECAELGVQWPGRARYPTYFPATTALELPARIAAIASDVDGTLLRSDSTLHPENARAMLEASLRLRFFVATGKCRAGALAALTDESVRALVERTGGVFNNGLVVYDGSGTIVHERVLAAEVVRDCLAFSRTSQLDATSFSRDDLRCLQVTPRTDELADRYKEPRPVACDEAALIATRPNKLLLLGSAEDVLAARSAVDALVAGRATTTIALPTMLEVLPLGASKREGVAAYCALFGIHEATELLAIGDGENDAEMLRCAAVGVAMGNAGRAARDAADIVVDDNDAAGAAQAIRLALALTAPE